MSTASVTATKTGPVKAFPFQKMLPKESITTLWGESGSGKTTITSWYELEALKAGHVVLHIEQDENLHSMKRRLQLMNAGVGCPPEKVRKNLKLFFESDIKLDTDDGRDKLMGLVEKYRPSVLVLSPIGNMVKGDINMQPATAAFFDNLKEIRRAHACTIVLHGHLNKRGKPSGSQFWINMTEMAWLMEKIPDVVQGAPHLMLVSQLKARTEAPMGFEWTLTPPTFRPDFVGVRADNLSVPERFMMASVLGFVYDQHQSNYEAWKRQSDDEEFDAEGRRKKRKDYWVTYQEYLKLHENTMGNKAKAWEMFQTAASMGLITRMAPGPKGVQRFLSNEKTLTWLRANTVGATMGTKPPSMIRSPVVAEVMSEDPVEVVKTEEEATEEAWIERIADDLEEWNTMTYGHLADED